MKKIIRVTSFVILSATIFADTCPQCFVEVLSSDAYCPNCGSNLTTWRQHVRAQEPSSIAAKPFDEAQSSRQDAERSSGSDVTPLEISLLGPVGLPGGSFDSVTGFQLSLIYGDSEIMKGVQLGLIQYDVEMYGVQVGLWNQVAKGNGVQVGAFNKMETLYGVQLGLVNIAATTTSGCQFGLLNLIMDNQVPFFPIFNCYY